MHGMEAVFFMFMSAVLAAVAQRLASFDARIRLAEIAIANLQDHIRD